ncbi:MAG: PilZ domain-containing protein [Candidatus Eremiobacterota bacterium]
MNLSQETPGKGEVGGLLRDLFRPARLADFVDCQGERLIVRTPKPLEMGQRVRLRLTLPSHPKVRMQVGTCRALPGGGYVVVGRLLDGPNLPAGAPRAEPFLRGESRYPCRTRVLSRGLPGYRALTLDISRTGMQLETDGRLPVGVQLNMVLELSEQGAGLACTARVAWCAPHEGQHRFRVGLEFLSPSDELMRALDSLVRRAAGEEFNLITGLAKPLPPAPVAERRVRNEQRTPLRGRLERYSIEDDLINLRLRTPDGQEKQINIRSPIAVQDRRGQAGLEVECLGRSEGPGRHSYRLLNSRQETILEVEAEPT